MNCKIYINKGEPLISCCEETLSDGSKVNNIYLKGNPDPIAAINDRAATDAMTLFAKALEVAGGERPLIL